jgi:hypothetical protein
MLKKRFVIGIAVIALAVILASTTGLVTDILGGVVTSQAAAKMPITDNSFMFIITINSTSFENDIQKLKNLDELMEEMEIADETNTLPARFSGINLEITKIGSYYYEEKDEGSNGDNIIVGIASKADIFDRSESMLKLKGDGEGDEAYKILQQEFSKIVRDLNSTDFRFSWVVIPLKELYEDDLYVNMGGSGR